MSQHYTDPTRENEPHALPDIEIFYMDDELSLFMAEIEGDDPPELGFYYWFCFPGCLPTGEAVGPFMSEEIALSEARQA